LKNKKNMAVEKYPVSYWEGKFNALSSGGSEGYLHL
jgi:hypothetical protein